ncbi:MAG: phosphonate C-P lyase system protein PhnK [Pseudomonadota bacterium]
MADQPLLSGKDLTKMYGDRVGCENVSLDIYEGEVIAIVGESGSGKSTLLSLLSTQLDATSGAVCYRGKDGATRNLADMTEAERRYLLRTDWGFIHQDARNGLRMDVSAGGNVGERLMAVGWRHYGDIRGAAEGWLSQVEIGEDRIDDRPSTFSGGMRQRLQIAKNMVTRPRLIFMDEPTGGLDVSVQARLLDLIRSFVTGYGLAAIIVTHDLAVARHLSHRTIVMRHGRVIEMGLTDQVLDDPHAAYTQLLVSSVLQ